MKYVEAYYEGTEEAVSTVSDVTCECDCCTKNRKAEVDGVLAVTKCGDGDETEPIQCDDCLTEVEHYDATLNQFTTLGTDGIEAELFRIGIQPHDLVAIVKLDELKALLAARA